MGWRYHIMNDIPVTDMPLRTKAANMAAEFAHAAWQETRQIENAAHNVWKTAKDHADDVAAEQAWAEGEIERVEAAKLAALADAQARVDEDRKEITP